jgi:hypothetical protein
MATLRDLDPQPFESAPADSLPVAAPDDRWVVLVGTAGPVSAVAPGTTLAAGARPPGILVAAADLDLRAALQSAAFTQFADVSALVLIESGPGNAGEPGIAGVVAGETLAQLMRRGQVRGFGSVLPGVPDIPMIARSCGYLEGGAVCATPMSFDARPYSMPDCPDNRGLAAHRFVW